MMLFKLSLKNIKKSFKDYAIYFFTLILGVAIFYVFNSLDGQSAALEVSKSTHEIIKLMTELLGAVSVFVSFILGFLIVYASRFLMKRRHKEFAIYLTLGMSKRKISRILLFETILIGVISLFVGLLIGVFASQGMSILVANAFDANMDRFVFSFSYEAFIKTLCYFGIMYILVMIFNTLSVSKCKLIDLLNSHKKSEKIKLKNPILCVIIFIISVLSLSYAYYKVTYDLQALMDFKGIFVPIIIGTVSTFFIFWSLSGLLLKIFMSIEKVYYKGLNSFVLRQVSSKINTAVFSISIICLMLFITICTLSSSFSIKQSLNENLRKKAPMDIQLEQKRDDESSSLGIQTMKTIPELYNSVNVNLDKYLKDINVYNLYEFEDFTLESFLGDYYSKAIKKYPFLLGAEKEIVMSVSDYNKMANIYGNQTYSLKPNEYMVISDYDNMKLTRNISLKENNKITILGNELVPKYRECKEGTVFMSVTASNTGVIIVSDEILNKSYITSSGLIANYKASTETEKIRAEDFLLSTYKSFVENESYSFGGVTKIELKEAGMGISAVVTFIALYLGIIFLISSAAILALKELSESADNKSRFLVLSKIGTEPSMLNKALFLQIAIFFMFPLILAIIHSIFGLKVCNIILDALGKSDMGNSIVFTSLFLILIYGGYFLITYFCSKRIIKE